MKLRYDDRNQVCLMRVRVKKEQFMATYFVNTLEILTLKTVL